MNEIKKLLKEKSRALSGSKYKEAAELCNAMGNVLVNQERYDEALEQHVEELQYSEISGDQLSIAVACRKIGECYTHLNNFKKALHHIRKYFDISVSLNSDLEKQRAYATFGRTYYLKYQHEIASGNVNSSTVTLDRAEHAYCKALELLPKLVSEIKPIELAEMRCRLCLNWGLISENRGNYEVSCKRIKEAFDIASKYRLLEDIQRCGLALGTVYQKLGEFCAADQAYEVALSAAKKLQNKSMMCEILLSQSTNLISQENFNDAKKCLKVGYKLRTANVEDHKKIAKLFKVCIGLYRCDKKLNMTKDYQEKKVLLEKIADGLASINCYKLAIQKYLLTLDCMLKAHATMSEKAPIYFSLAKTYFDDGNNSKALEYFEKEFNCNEDKPLEQIKTLWEIADVLEKERNVDKMEEIYLKSVFIAEKAGKVKHLHESLSKLYSFYKDIKKSDRAEEVKKKLDSIKFECYSDSETDDDEEETQNPFNEIDLSDLSDSDKNEEEITSARRQTKKIEAKINEKGETPLHEACINGNLNMVQKLIENGHSVNVRDFAGWTPLHEACNYGYYDIAEYLLEKGANINDPGGPECGGITALHDAASCGNFDVMQLLMDKGASVTVLDENKETPLHALLQWKHRVLNDVDVVTLRQCEIVENALRSKMQEAGKPSDGIISISSEAVISDNSPYINSISDRVTEKRSRSPSLSPDIESDSEDEVCSTPPYVINQDLNDANNAKAEYKSVMKNLRRSAAALTPVKSQPHAEVSGPPLLNENEIVDEWLIKDTKELPKAKRKKRKISKLNVRTSKRIDNYLISEDISREKDASMNNLAVNEDSNFSITSVSSTDKNIETSPNQKWESSKVSFCLRIHIANKLILVPVPDDASTISWLSEEAALRFQALDGSKPHLTLMKNGALLSGSDCIKNIFSNNEEVMSSVESWEEPSLEERYVQICAKRSTVVSSLVRKQFQCLTTSSDLNFSNCSVPPLHLSIIFSTVTFAKSLHHLNIRGIAINDSNLKEFISCIPSFSTLLSLNMSCCCLTSESFEKITDFLNNETHQNMLPALKSLDLSYNYFSSGSSFLPLLNLKSLVSLNLSSCGLSSNLLSNQAFCQKLESKHNLENFNVSGNILGESGITNLLNHLPKLGLKTLNLKHNLDGGIHLGSKLFTFFSDLFPFLTELILQGCYLTDADINQISLVLAYCPQLQVCDLSANPSISSNSLCNFMNRAHDYHISITELNITGTCVWHHENFTILTDLLGFKTLKQLFVDNCPENLIEILVESWKSKWGDRANCLNFGFWELSII